MNWVEKRLGDVVRLRSGGTPNKAEPRYWDGHIPWLSSKDLVTPRIYDAPLKVTDEAVGNGTRLMPENTVMFVVRGMSLASDFRVSITKKPCTFNQDLKAVECGPAVLPEFLYYALVAQRDQIRGRAGEASHGTKKLESHTVENIRLSLPTSLDTQRRVGSVASAYDDLIENNRKRITLLEEAARLLYREWFVHLRFPGHEHVKVANGVPAGWAPRALGELVEVVKDTVKPAQFAEDDVHIGLEHIPRRSFTLADWEPAEGLASGKTRFREGDILFGKIRPYFHKVGFALRNGLASSDALVWRVKEVDDWPLVVCATSCDHFVAVASKTVREGSKMPRADWNVLKKYPVPKPSEGILATFNDAIRPITSQCKTLALQTRALSEARDLLLPRLMSGELAV